MNNSTIIGLSALAIMAVLALFVINLTPALSKGEASQTIPAGDFKAIDVYHHGAPYPLNFQQQQIAIDAISRAVEVKKSDYPAPKGPFTFEKIVITRYKGPSVELIPIQYDERNLVFSLNGVNDKVYFIELSGGIFRRMLDSIPEK